MKFLVFNARSKDKFTKKIYAKDSVHVFEPERANEIIATGRAKEIGVDKIPKVELRKFAAEFGLETYKKQKAEIVEMITEYIKNKVDAEDEIDENGGNGEPGEGQVDETGNGEGQVDGEGDGQE